MMLGIPGLLFRDFFIYLFLVYFILFIFFFSIRPPDPISGNAFNGIAGKNGGMA